MAGRTDPGRSLVLPVSVGVIGLALIGFGQLVPNRHAIEDDLTSRSTEALVSADLVGLSVSFAGRDATIAGANASSAERAEEVVASVTGVRVAHAELSDGSAPTPAPVPDPTEAPTEAPVETSAPAATSAEPSAPAKTPAGSAKPVAIPVGFTLVDGTITVTGTVRSQSAANALVAAATSADNGWTVVDRLRVVESLPAPAPAPNRLPAVTRLLAQAPIDGPKLVIQYRQDTVILRGTPADAGTERALLAAATATVATKSAVIDGLDTP